MITAKDGLPIIYLKTQDDWREWLDKNHDSAPGVWLQFYKKASGVESINYDQALEEALCFGWIDGIANKYDEKSYLQRFVPRRPKSMWSKINVAHIKRLKKMGKMMPAGMSAYEAAKKDGRIASAYDSPANTKIPEDFLKELAKNSKAEKFFQTLNKTNTYAIAWRLQTAKKPETKQKRMQQILDMLAREEKFH